MDEICLKSSKFIFIVFVSKSLSVNNIFTWNPIYCTIFVNWIFISSVDYIVVVGRLLYVSSIWFSFIQIDCLCKLFFVFFMIIVCLGFIIHFFFRLWFGFVNLCVWEFICASKHYYVPIVCLDGCFVYLTYQF